MQKELGQKDRLIQQQQFKLDETLRKLTDSNRQQVCPSSKYKTALWNLRQIFTSFSYLFLCNTQADLQRELEHKQRILQELTDRDEDEVRPMQQTGTFNLLL